MKKLLLAVVAFAALSGLPAAAQTFYGYAGYSTYGGNFDLEALANTGPYPELGGTYVTEDKWTSIGGETEVLGVLFYWNVNRRPTSDDLIIRSYELVSGPAVNFTPTGLAITSAHYTSYYDLPYYEVWYTFANNAQLPAGSVSVYRIYTNYGYFNLKITFI